ncbi:hypothetical protein POSPLADRAFT_1179620 [Postia placenta MAD-698-R-SB12]|uniref:Zn(2)-C6 fungal-type domain-containing protein n=1 Tax=Postia placenta MAD-698-R-SB12 TaxID=670580 RepID=A0A1X6N5Y5_9APHY|nr:hypothetical protein POSPLADRAFT_1179620 [Postia placenta MAD-698-R-SB12]OSX64014.1 hypothetical protein POSPLADRAFT_1179620 [Postia placenta MAD-698-R-SB12]
MATEVDSSTATGIPNPALGKPLPPYALAWGPSVCRPAFLPNTYDNRIAPEYIFLISDTDTETDATPNTGRYVVIERCDGCRDVRQACTRTLPACSRCVASKRECIVSQKIYVALPNPKVPHTRKANLSSVGVVRGEAVERERSCALNADLSKRRKGANKQKGSREQRRLLPKTAVREIRSKIKKAGIKPRWPSERQTGKKRRVISGRKVSAKPMISESTAFAPTPQTGVVWLPISPTPNSPTPNEALRSPQQPLPGRPRIWTSSKHDLRKILPNLAREVNGLVFGVRQLVQSAEVDEAPKSAEAVYSIPPVNLDDVEPQRVCQPTHLHPSFQIDIAMPGSISAFHSYSSAYGPSIDAPGGLDGIALYRISPAPDSEEETAAGTVSHAVYKHPRQSQSPSTVSHPVSTTHTWISPINVRKAVAGPHPPDIHDASSLSCSTNLSNTVPRDVTVQPQHIHQSQALSEGQSKLFLRHNYYEGYGPELGSTEHVSSQSRCDFVLPLSANNFPFQDLRAPTTAAFSQIEADAAMHNPSVLWWPGQLYADLCYLPLGTYAEGWHLLAPLSSTSLRRTQSHYEQAALDVHVSLPLEKMNDVDGLPEESQIARQRSSSPSEAGESPSIPLRCITSRTTTTAEDTASLALPLAGSSGLGNDQGQSSVQPDEVLDTTSYVPGWWPEEIKALVNNQTLQIPIRVILCRDSPLFPLSLPPEYGCVFLGFFYIKEVSMVVIGDKEPTPTSAAASLDHCREIGDRMCWDFKLEWTPGGEFVYPSMDIPLVPWWAVAQEATPYTHPQGDIPPFTLLPLHLLAANVASDFQFENGTSENHSANQLALGQAYQGHQL